MKTISYEELKKLTKEHSELEKKIIDNLPDKADECHCDGESFNYIHYGNWLEIMSVCLKCGGIKL